jgi:transposase
MRILALDLGTASTKTYVHILDTETGEIQRQSFPTSITEFLAILRRIKPDQVVVEPTPITGLLVDLCQAENIQVKVANVRDPAWQNRTNKTDRNDAELLARLAATGQLRTVCVPPRDVREWRSLIFYRHQMVRERIRCKNRIKSVLRNELISTKGLWSKLGMTSARCIAKPLSLCDQSEFWRGILWEEIARLAEIQKRLESISGKLDQLAESKIETRALSALPGVGNRLAETIVATLVTAQRFHNRREVAAYIGLCPRVEQSGKHVVYGRITKAGNRLLRSLLVEVAWLGIRHDPWMKAIYDQVLRGDPSRSNRAVTAVARRLLIRCWAILRDLERTPPPTKSVKKTVRVKSSRKADTRVRRKAA